MDDDEIRTMGAWALALMVMRDKSGDTQAEMNLDRILKKREELEKEEIERRSLRRFFL